MKGINIFNDRRYLFSRELYLHENDEFIASDLLSVFTQETQRLIAEPVPGIKATPHEENARYFDVLVDGPKEVCYQVPTM